MDSVQGVPSKSVNKLTLDKATAAAIEKGMTEMQASASSQPSGNAIPIQMTDVPNKFATTANLSLMPSFNFIKFLKIIN